MSLVELGTPLLNAIATLRKLGFAQQRPDQALAQWVQQTSESKQQHPDWLLLAAELHLSLGQYEQALPFYLTLNDHYLSGFCNLLLGNGAQAAECWAPLLLEHPTHWVATLFGLVTGQVTHKPTFFQLRNHLEKDLTHLLRAEQFAMADNLIAQADYLAGLHPESYKFIARALFNQGNVNLAEVFLCHSMVILPTDPEGYYHLACIMQERNDPVATKTLLGQVLLLSPTHWVVKQLIGLTYRRSHN
jgi:tetratricopeptide (TPR) repeat protein